jgi:hypothetical protein
LKALARKGREKVAMGSFSRGTTDWAAAAEGGA